MSSNTVYVIGAGASFEVNLPTGNELKTHISNILNMALDPTFGHFKGGNGELYQSLKTHSTDTKSELTLYLQACKHIRANMPLAISIDNFIDSQRNNDAVALCGKIGIVNAILKAERDSKLYFHGSAMPQRIQFSKLEGTWYLPFFRTLTENCVVEDLKDRFSKVTLIIFNYDRCIEHFLYHALKTYYLLDDEKALEVINELEIIHPYGTVGALRWQEKNSSTVVDFGGEINWRDYINYAQRIRTFTEETHSEIDLAINKKMEKARKLVFLGFAFHRLNMKILSKSKSLRYQAMHTVKCYATAYESSSSDREAIYNEIRHLYEYEPIIKIEDMTCSNLFKNYSRSLGFG